MSFKNYDLKMHVNSCGRMTLKSTSKNFGKNLHFNVLKDWDETANLALLEGSLGVLRVVGGFGGFGEIDGLVQMQSKGRFVGMYRVREIFPCSKDGLKAIHTRMGGKTNTVLFGTLD